MKLFAAICGTAALVTAAVNQPILSNFDKTYGHLETPLPALTRALLWKGGAVPTTLLVVSAVIVFIGLLKKDNRLMVIGGVLSIALMLGAATIVPAAVMVPAHGGDGEALPVKRDSIRD